LPQGTSHAARVGDWIKMKSVTLKFYIEPPSAAIAPIVEEYNEVGVVVALDRNPKDTTPPVLTGGTAGGLLSGAANNPMLKYYDINNVTFKGRYKILYKKIVRVAPVQSPIVPATGLQSTGYPPFARWTWTCTAPFKVKYRSNPQEGTLPDNQELCVFFFSDSGTLPHPYVSCYSRFRFKDA